MPKHAIYLPNGKAFEIRTDPDADVKAIRDFMATATAVNLDIVVDGKPATLLLWGEVLKNSYIIVTH
jgi:hypothetical protein